MNIIGLLNTWSQSFRAAASFLLLLLIGTMDYLTGYMFRLDLFYLVPVAYAAWYIDRNTGYVFSLAAAGIITLSDALSGKTFGHFLLELWNASMRLGFYLIVVFLMAWVRSTMQERKELIGELQKTLQEVKELRGILPICSSCKKIRTDEGYWQHVDVYIRDNTNAEFSHGICDDCLKKLYPEYYGKTMKMKDGQ